MIIINKQFELFEEMNKNEIEFKNKLKVLLFKDKLFIKKL